MTNIRSGVGGCEGVQHVVGQSLLFLSFYDNTLPTQNQLRRVSNTEWADRICTLKGISRSSKWNICNSAAARHETGLFLLGLVSDLRLAAGALAWCGTEVAQLDQSNKLSLKLVPDSRFGWRLWGSVRQQAKAFYITATWLCESSQWPSASLSPSDRATIAPPPLCHHLPLRLFVMRAPSHQLPPQSFPEEPFLCSHRFVVVTGQTKRNENGWIFGAAVVMTS